MPVANDMHRRAFALALFGGKSGYVSFDYLDEKLSIMLRARTVDELLGPLDQENRARFHMFFADIVANRGPQ